MDDLDNKQIENEILNEISECREDERNSQNQMVQIIATAGTVLGVMLGTSIFGGGNIVSKEVLFLLSNIVFGTACSYIATLGIGNVLRYHYIQKLEDKLSLLYCDNNIEKVSLVQWMSFTSPIMTRNPLHLRSKYAILHYLAYTLSVISTVIFSIGVTCFLYYKLDKHTVIDKISIFSLGIIFVISLFSYIIISLKGDTISKEVFEKSLEKKKIRLKQKAEREKERTTYIKKSEMIKALMYFIYPKVKDSQKMLLIILGYILAIFLIEGYIDMNKIKENFGLLILSIIVIDFLLYQARYQWNDIRGIEEDRLKVERLPIKILGEKYAIIISLTVICIRLFIMICIFYHITDNSIFTSICFNTGLVIILSIIYEWVRNKKYIFGTFFFVSLGYPLRIFIGMCAAYPIYVKQIINAFEGLLLELWRKCNLVQLCVDRTKHFSLGVLIAFMCAYVFMGAFSVILPWLYEAIEEKRKFEKTKKKHYEYLLTKVKIRYQKYIIKEKGNASTLICSKGNISDIWNWTYIASILIFSVLIIADCYYFSNDNFLSILFLELLFCVSSVYICIVPDTKKKRKISLMFLIAVLILKLILCFVNFGIVSYYIFIYCNQLLISLIYWFLRYHFQDNFNFFRECKRILLRLFILIIGKDAWKYLHK